MPKQLDFFDMFNETMKNFRQWAKSGIKELDDKLLTRV